MQNLYVETQLGTGQQIEKLKVSIEYRICTVCMFMFLSGNYTLEGFQNAPLIDQEEWKTKQTQEKLKSKGKLPVIVFSHGIMSSRNTYSTFCTQLASEGNVAVAVEHRLDVDLFDPFNINFLIVFDALRDLVSFLQFKKREKHTWRSVILTLLKVTFLHGCSSRFLN